MLYIHNTSNDPYFNMASEEYILKELKEEIFMLWQNSPVIVVGKNQNTIEEINTNFVNEENIAVVRRLSGGGAVYHDIGNVNFTYVVSYNNTFFDEFATFTKPIIETLKEIGIKAELQGRNDISIEGKKFSGNSQVVYKDRVLHHGTIMVDVNTEVLTKALKVKSSKIESKGIKSIRKRVTNINEHLTSPISGLDFLKILENHMKAENNLIDYKLTQEELDKINTLASMKYRTYSWNYGKSPSYNFKKEIEIPAGRIEFHFYIEEGIIKKADIFGDFFGERDSKDISNALIGIKHSKTQVEKVFNDFDIDYYFHSLSKDSVPNLVEKLFE